MEFVEKRLIKDVPIDAAVIAIIDSIDVERR